MIHESVHAIRSASPKSYNALSDAIFEILSVDSEALSGAWKSVAKTYQDQIRDKDGNLNRELINEELVANVTSNLLFNEEFINELAPVNKGLVQRVFEAIKDLFDKVFKRYDKTPFIDHESEAAMKLLHKEYDRIKVLYESALKDTKKIQTEKGKTADDGGVMYSFAGENSEKANKEMLNLAKKMKKDGVSDEEIWKLTGWGKGVDGKWRYEIDDSKAEFYKHGNFSNPDLNRYKELEKMFLYGDITPEQNAELTALIKKLDGVRKTPKYLSEFLKHNELFEAYPELKDIKVGFFPLKDGNNGVFRASDNLIAINEKLNDSDAKSTLLHEIQHVLQFVEGFTGGASADYYKQRINQAKESRKVLNWIRELKQTQEENPDVTDILKLNNMLRDEYEKSDLNEFIPSSEIQREAMEKFYSESAISYLEEVVRIYGLDKSIDGNDPYDMYKNTPGEVEARDVQERQDMSTDERKNSFPESMRLENNGLFVENAVSYSLSKEAIAEIDKVISDKNYGGDIKLTDMTPSIMISQKGVDDRPMYMKASHIRENILTESEAKKLGLPVNKKTHYHGLGKPLFLKIINDLESVTRAYRGTPNAENLDRREQYFLLISQYKDADKNTVNVPVYINKGAFDNRVYVTTNKIATVFGKRNFETYINKELQNGNIIRIKNKSINTSESSPPIGDNYSKDTSINIILGTTEIVNTELYSKSSSKSVTNLNNIESDYVRGYVKDDFQNFKQEILSVLDEEIEKAKRYESERKTTISKPRRKTTAEVIEASTYIGDEGQKVTIVPEGTPGAKKVYISSNLYLSADDTCGARSKAHTLKGALLAFDRCDITTAPSSATGSGAVVMLPTSLSSDAQST